MGHFIISVVPAYFVVTSVCIPLLSVMHAHYVQRVQAFQSLADMNTADDLKHRIKQITGRLPHHAYVPDSLLRRPTFASWCQPSK